MIDSGFHKERISVTNNQEFKQVFPKNTNGSYIVYIEGSGKLDVEFVFEENTKWHVLWINESDQNLIIREKIYLNKDAMLNMNYAELSSGNHKKQTLIEMIGNGSYVHVKGAAMVFDQLYWDLQAVHHARHTYAQLDNHAIVLKDTKFEIEVTGQIDKGYSQSETHQSTKVMNLGHESDAIVFPKLLIDENDVAASHAASVGRPNEEHIYYLTSRGIHKDDAMRLMLKGYLLPITEDIKDETIKERLITEIETKVDSQWKTK